MDEREDGTDHGAAPARGSRRPTRRRFLAAAGVTLLAAACGGGGRRGAGPAPSTTAGTVPTTAGTTSTGPPPVAHFVARGPDTSPRVALTFHVDGDLALAQQLLDVLARRRTPMTAFVVGSWLDANPTWARRLADAGHELANHTYAHPPFASLAPAAMADEIARCRDVLVRLTGRPGTCFRPSGTSDGTTPPRSEVLAAAGAAGYATVLGYDVDPLDYQQPAPAVVAQRTLAAAGPGSVVSLHFGYPATIAALPAILDGLDERGLVTVTASKLLQTS